MLPFQTIPTYICLLTPAPSKSWEKFYRFINFGGTVLRNPEVRYFTWLLPIIQLVNKFLAIFLKTMTRWQQHVSHLQDSRMTTRLCLNSATSGGIKELIQMGIGGVRIKTREIWGFIGMCVRLLTRVSYTVVIMPNFLLACFVTITRKAGTASHQVTLGSCMPDSFGYWSETDVKSSGSINQSQSVVHCRIHQDRWILIQQTHFYRVSLKYQHGKCWILKQNNSQSRE